jgi:hypothetical protein
LPYAMTKLDDDFRVAPKEQVSAGRQTIRAR